MGARSSTEERTFKLQTEWSTWIRGTETKNQHHWQTGSSHSVDTARATGEPPKVKTVCRPHCAWPYRGGVVTHSQSERERGNEKERANPNSSSTTRRRRCCCIHLSLWARPNPLQGAHSTLVGSVLHRRIRPGAKRWCLHFTKTVS